MTPLEFSLYALAERLHMTVTAIQAMPWEEFNGWHRYYAEVERKQNPSMLDSPEAMLGGFGL
jgi:hypothetical protein